MSRPNAMVCGHDPDRTYGAPLAESRAMPTRDQMRAALGIRPWDPIRCTPGDVFGRLEVVSGDGRDRLCRCTCGRARQVQAWRLVHGEVTACHRCSQVRRVAKRGHTLRRCYAPPTADSCR